MSTSRRRWAKHAVAEALREQRESLGLSRRELADRSGLSYPYVSQLENGDREPSLDALSKLASALGVATEDLLKPTAHSHEPLASAAPGLEPPAAAVAGRSEAAQPGPGRWLKNPAYPPGPAPTRQAPGRTGYDAAVERAYMVLAELPPGRRLDAAGALLARCLRDSGARP